MKDTPATDDDIRELADGAAREIIAGLKAISDKTRKPEPKDTPVNSVAQQLEIAARDAEYHQTQSLKNLQPPYLARLRELQALVALTPGQVIELELLLKKRWV